MTAASARGRRSYTTTWDTIFIAARHALAEAEQIYFLGFGYNTTNLQRLGVFRTKWTAERREKCVVRGTSRGLSVREWHKTCAKSLNGAMLPTPRFQQGITSFLRNAVDAD